MQMVEPSKLLDLVHESRLAYGMALQTLFEAYAASAWAVVKSQLPASSIVLDTLEPPELSRSPLPDDDIPYWARPEWRDEDGDILPAYIARAARLNRTLSPELGIDEAAPDLATQIHSHAAQHMQAVASQAVTVSKYRLEERNLPGCLVIAKPTLYIKQEDFNVKSRAWTLFGVVR
jgi:hypothetical protein